MKAYTILMPNLRINSLIEDGDVRSIGYWWVRAGLIEILRIIRNRCHKQRPYEPVQGNVWVGIRSIVLMVGSVDGFVYARDHRQIPEIVNEPAQPHQPISISIRSGTDGRVRFRFWELLIDAINKAIYEPVQANMWVGVRSIVLIIGSVDGFVYANNHRWIPEISIKPAQPHQRISIAIQSCMDDGIRSIVSIRGW